MKPSGNPKETVMSLRSLTAISVAAFAGAATLALSMGPASAFTLAGPSLEQPLASSPIDKVYWRHRGWGWGPGAIIGGLAAGALVGGYYGGYYGPGPGYYGPGYYGRGYGNCWRDQWGRVHCS
jgi:hypothetical protein